METEKVIMMIEKEMFDFCESLTPKELFLLKECIEHQIILNEL